MFNKWKDVSKHGKPKKSSWYLTLEEVIDKETGALKGHMLSVWYYSCEKDWWFRRPSNAYSEYVVISWKRVPFHPLFNKKAYNGEMEHPGTLPKLTEFDKSL